MKTDEEVLENISRNIVRLRGDRTLGWLAGQSGTYPINISRIEHGEHMPGAGLLTRLAEALETPVDVLVSSGRRRQAQ